MRADGKIVKLGEITSDAEKSYFLDNTKDKADDGKATHTSVVPQQPRRKDLRLLKVDIDGNYLSYIPFMISKVQIASQNRKVEVRFPQCFSNERRVPGCQRRGIRGKLRDFGKRQLHTGKSLRTRFLKSLFKGKRRVRVVEAKPRLYIDSHVLLLTVCRVFLAAADQRGNGFLEIRVPVL